jgi:hypothetical protein
MPQMDDREGFGCGMARNIVARHSWEVEDNACSAWWCSRVLHGPTVITHG